MIRLFFYAPLEDCIRRVVDQNGISAKEAEKKIAKIDKYRADYYKYYTGNAWNDARNYDFCLDSSPHYTCIFQIFAKNQNQWRINCFFNL